MLRGVRKTEPPLVISPRQVVRTYLVLGGLYTLSASLIWGVNTLFLLHAGLDIFGVFVANAAFTASMAVFEVPTGVLADTRGRRASFLLSIIVLFPGTLGYVGAAAAGGSLASSSSPRWFWVSATASTRERWKRGL